jgi:hypothetical protein
MQIDVINWQGKRLPEGLDQPDKTLFLAPEFPQQHANLLLYPIEGDPKEHVKKIAGLLGQDEYTLRGQLTGRGFMALMRNQSVAPVAGAAAELNKLGYRTRLLRDNMFFRIPAPRRVSGLTWSDNGVSFTTAADAPPIDIARGEPAVAIIGDLEAPRQTARLRQNDARRSAQPGDPGFSFHSIVDRLRSYHCDLYFPYQWIALRIITDNFNFTCLGADVAQFAAQSLATLLDRLADGPLQIFWDDRFAETAAFGMRRQIESAARAEKIVLTLRDDIDETQFHYYSRFRYILELASGFKCFP